MPRPRRATTEAERDERFLERHVFRPAERRQDAPATAEKLTLAVDFHGVIHSHLAPSFGPTIADDPPVPGAIDFLIAASGRFKIALTTAKLSDPATRAVAVESLLGWFGRNGLGREWFSVEPLMTGRIALCHTRPRAHVTLDDRGVTFAGTFPDIDELAGFKPWNR